MDTANQTEIAARLKLLSLLAALGGLAILLLVTIFMSIILVLALRIQSAASDVKSEAQQSHAAWCAAEENATQSIRTSTTFLAKNPNGLIADGVVVVSPEQIQDSIDRQRAFLDAIRANVLCSERK